MENGDTHTSPTRARVPSAPLVWAAPHSSLLMMPLRMSPSSSCPRPLWHPLRGRPLTAARLAVLCCCYVHGRHTNCKTEGKSSSGSGTHPTCGVHPEVPEYTTDLTRLAHCSICRQTPRAGLLVWLCPSVAADVPTCDRLYQCQQPQLPGRCRTWQSEKIVIQYWNANLCTEEWTPLPGR